MYGRLTKESLLAEVLTLLAIMALLVTIPAFIEILTDDMSRAGKPEQPTTTTPPPPPEPKVETNYSFISDSTTTLVIILACVIIAGIIIACACWAVKNLRSRNTSVGAEAMELKLIASKTQATLTTTLTSYMEAVTSPETILFRPLFLDMENPKVAEMDKFAQQSHDLVKRVNTYSNLSGKEILEREGAIRADELEVRRIEKLWDGLVKDADYVPTPIMTTRERNRARKLLNTALNDTAAPNERKIASTRLQELIKKTRKNFTGQGFPTTTWDAMLEAVQKAPETAGKQLPAPEWYTPLNPALT